MSKEWAWSYSKKKAFDTCPKRHYEVEVAKNYKDESEQLAWGNSVHDAFAKAIRDKVPLPATMSVYQTWIDKALAHGGEQMVEQKYALARDFTAQPYFGPKVWYRGIADWVSLDRANRKAIAWDWKTGKVKHDSTQLMLMAACLFVHFPELEVVETEFVWLQEGCTTKDTWTREDLRRELIRLIPEVDAMETAYKTMSFPPKPGRLCIKWCPVTSCPFYKKGN